MADLTLAMHFARAGMGYTGAWDQGACEITIDHLRRRSGELHGEVVIASAIVARGKGHLHRASFNLSSSTSRDRLAKMLVDRSRPQELPWDIMLEEFCTAVLNAERAGSPVVKVGQLAPRSEDFYLVDPLLPDGKPTIVYGAGGTGKSYLADMLAVMVASGHQALGWRVRQGAVLYLDWETDAYEIDERIKRIAAGMGIGAPPVLYRACTAPLEDMAEDVARRVADEHVALVVVDSVGMASGTSRDGGDANESAIRLFGAIRYLGASVLALDHITGEDVRSDKAVAKPYGSIYKVNLARSVWELRRSSEQDHSGDWHLGLYHRKVNRGGLHQAIGLRVRHLENSVEFLREEIDDELSVAMTNGVRIERALRHGALSVAEIAEATGLADNVIRAVISKDKGRGRFVKVGDKWGRNVVAQPVAEDPRRVA